MEPAQSVSGFHRNGRDEQLCLDIRSEGKLYRLSASTRIPSLRTDRLSPAGFAPTNTRTFISLASSFTTEDRYSGCRHSRIGWMRRGTSKNSPWQTCRRMPLFVTRKLSATLTLARCEKTSKAEQQLQKFCADARVRLFRPGQCCAELHGSPVARSMRSPSTVAPGQ